MVYPFKTEMVNAVEWHSLMQISLRSQGVENEICRKMLRLSTRDTTIVPLEVKVLENGEIYIRAIDPAYTNPRPDENQQFK